MEYREKWVLIENGEQGIELEGPFVSISGISSRFQGPAAVHRLSVFRQKA